MLRWRPAREAAENAIFERPLPRRGAPDDPSERAPVRPERIKLQVALTGAAFVLLGGGLFSWKVWGEGLPLLPSQPEGLWQIEIGIAVRGADRDASVRAALPEPSQRQLVFGEQFSSGGLRLSLRDDARKGRQAVWRGPAPDLFELGVGFRVQIDPQRRKLPTGPTRPAPEPVAETWGRPDADFPGDDPAVLERIETMGAVRKDDVGGWIRTLYAFVRHEIRPGQADDPLLVLRIGEGSRQGRERLLATLLRGAGVPSRIVRGLELGEDNTRERIWVEAWADGRWWPMSVTSRFFGNLPDDFVTFGPSTEPMVVGSNVESVEYRFEAILQRLTAQEVATLMAPDAGILSWLSLHRLPAGTQAALRVLLLMPLGALLLTLLRNVAGIPSYGTFMPMLIALAMRGTGLSIGLLLVGIVLVIGVLGRILITRLRLLLVPRLSVLLSLVVLTVALMGLVGVEFDDRNFFQGILFPIVILTMLVERFSITLEEEGWREALERAFWSVLIAVLVYPVFRSESLELLFVSYPELVLVVIGLLVWLGAYTGYRLNELVRFRASSFGSAS